MSLATRQRIAGSCTGKVRFETFGRAQRVARRQSQDQAGRFLAYACQHCGRFHVGSSVGNFTTDQIRDSRRPFAVFGRKGQGPEELLGWSATEDGADLAAWVKKQPGWTLTRVAERRRRPR